jgi:hypothetical protein
MGFQPLTKVVSTGCARRHALGRTSNTFAFQQPARPCSLIDGNRVVAENLPPRAGRGSFLADAMLAEAARE